MCLNLNKIGFHVRKNAKIECRLLSQMINTKFVIEFLT